MKQRTPLSLEGQADLIAGIVKRCAMLNGDVAAETHLSLRKDDVVELQLIERRLRRIAPYEARIRNMVTGQ